MENSKENNQVLKGESQQLKPLKDQEKKTHHFHSTPKARQVYISNLKELTFYSITQRHSTSWQTSFNMLGSLYTGCAFG